MAFAGLGMKPTRKALFQLEVDQKNFNRWFQKFWKLERKYVAEAFKKTGFDLMRDVLRNTPVRTGRARMAWGGFHKIHGKKPPPARVGLDTLDPMQEARGYLESRAEDESAPRFGNWQPYIEIHNPVRYIPFLEAGWSPQAGPGQMVANNLRRHIDRFKKAVKKKISQAGEDSQEKL